VLKAAKMVDARSKVKNVSVVGRKGKAVMEAQAVSSTAFQFSTSTNTFMLWSLYSVQ
jgi:hypothetical protein